MILPYSAHAPGQQAAVAHLSCEMQAAAAGVTVVSDCSSPEYCTKYTITKLENYFNHLKK